MSGARISRRAFVATAGAVLASITVPLASGPLSAFADEGESGIDSQGAEKDCVVILHTNDVHCAFLNGKTKLGYAAFVGYADAQRKAYGASSVGLVDAGDNVQGDFNGAYTKGEAPAKVVGACGYDVLVPGNHEFDYGLEQFFALRQTEGVPYVCCNFLDVGGSPVFDTYRVVEYATASGTSVRVGFVGATTPSTLTSSTPATFKDKDGNIVYSFCGDATGQSLYDAVQTAVDEARSVGGADYVVLLSHLGQQGAPDRWRSDSVVANTSGIDVVIDGHSHEMYVQKAKNILGEEVVITQTGTKFASFGRVEIDPAAGSVTVALDATGLDAISASLIEEASEEDVTVADLVAKIEVELDAVKNSKVATSEIYLRACEDDGVTWAIRLHETNLGDLVADAVFYHMSNRGVDCDVAVVNGGGIRANVAVGEVTYGNLISVHPYMNDVCVLEVTGQHILDMLEVGAMYAPRAGGGFLQVSEGMSYTVRTDVPTPVVLSDDGSVLKEIVGERRVKHAALFGEAIDPSKLYRLASNSYILLDGGTDMPIPANAADAKFMGTELDVLIEYIRVNLKGVIGQEYANEMGKGRITVTDHEDDDAPAPLGPGEADEQASGEANKSMKGTGTFAATADSANLYAAGAAALATTSAIVASAAVLAMAPEQP